METIESILWKLYFQMYFDITRGDKKVFRKFQQPLSERIKPGCSYHIDDAVYKWFCLARLRGLPLSGTNLQFKIREVAKKLQIDGFAASNGWLECFKGRHNIVSKVICGEANDVRADAVIGFKESLPKICEGYSLKNIYNIDETRLFYKAIPIETLHWRKTYKRKLTVSVQCNGLSEKESLVIGTYNTEFYWCAIMP